MMNKMVNGQWSIVKVRFCHCELFTFHHCPFTIDYYFLPGGGVLKLVRIKSFKKKITFLAPGFIVVVIADVKIA